MSQRLLIVESDPAVSALFGEWLQAMGWDVSVVGDGEGAMHVLRSQSIDGLILDLKVPVKDGLTMLTQLRQRFADIPVMVLATVDMTDSLLEALESGAHDYLTKPVSQHLFKQKCRRLFMQKRDAQPQPTGVERSKPKSN